MNSWIRLLGPRSTPSSECAALPLRAAPQLRLLDPALLTERNPTETKPRRSWWRWRKGGARDALIQPFTMFSLTRFNGEKTDCTCGCV